MKALAFVLLAACATDPVDIGDDPDPVFTDEERAALAELRYDTAPHTDPSNAYVDNDAARTFGQKLFFTLMTPESMVKARKSYEAAVALAPDNAEAIAKVGWTHWIDSISGWVPDPAASFDKAHACAARANSSKRR